MNEGDAGEAGRIGLEWWGEVGSDERGLGREMGDGSDCLGDDRDAGDDDRGLDRETEGRIESCLESEQLFSSSSSTSSTKSREDIGIAKGDWETCLSSRWREGGGPSCEGISCEGGKEGKMDINEDRRIEDIRILSFKRDE